MTITQTNNSNKIKEQASLKTKNEAGVMVHTFIPEPGRQKEGLEP